MSINIPLNMNIVGDIVCLIPNSRYGTFWSDLVFSPKGLPNRALHGLSLKILIFQMGQAMKFRPVQKNFEWSNHVAK